MHRAFSFPVTVERSRTKERLEASLAGLCELELRKQRQECLVLGALALGEPLPQDSSRGELACFSSWGQENLTLRRQLVRSLTCLVLRVEIPAALAPFHHTLDRKTPPFFSPFSFFLSFLSFHPNPILPHSFKYLTVFTAFPHCDQA